MSGAHEVRMPRLSESMSEATIVRWLRAPGSRVERGDELAEVETDKATVSFEADAGGVLEIVAEEGESREVGTLIARILDDPATPPSAAAPAASPVDGPPSRTATAVPGRSSRAATPAQGQPVRAAPAGRSPSSPLARRLARELGVDLSTVRGTGPHGRVVRADIEAAARSTRQPDAHDAPPTPTGTDPRGAATVVEPTGARRLVAERMVRSAREIPAFRLTAEVDMSGCVELRARIAEVAGDAPVPTVTDLVVAASGRALREFPRVNAAYDNGSVRCFARVNVGIAVDTPDVLLVPTVFDADALPLTAIAAGTRALVRRARDGGIRPDELTGATFTVSNLGMFGVTEFDALINPPQAAILAVGAARDVPRVVDGTVSVRPVLTLTLSCDHRVLDGAGAARFLRRLVELLEHPVALLLTSTTDRCGKERM